MKQISEFLLLYNNWIVMATVVLIILPGLFQSKGYRAAMDKVGNELVDILDQKRAWRRPDRRAWQIAIFLPLQTGILILLTRFQSRGAMIGLAILLLFLLIGELFFTLLDPEYAIMVVHYSDIGAQLHQIWLQSLLLVMLLILGNLRYNLPEQPWCIPVSCGIVSIIQVVMLYRLWFANGDRALYLAPAVPCAITACTQAVFVWILWGVGGYYAGICLEYRYFSWQSWLQTVFFYGNGFYVACMRCSGVLLLILTMIPVFGTACKYIKRSVSLSARLRIMLPAGGVTLGLGALCAFLLCQPNYVQTLPIPLTTWLGSSANLSADGSRYHTMDGSPMVLKNGATIYLSSMDLPYGKNFDVSVRVLDDFSDQPYLRFYPKTIDSGAVEFWVENQGGAAAERCSFRLTDRNGELKACFPRECLRTNVDTILPGEQICLFTLSRTDMRRTVYEELLLAVEVEARFTDRGHARMLRKGIGRDVLLSMNGVAIEHISNEGMCDVILSADGTLQWKKDVAYGWYPNAIGSFCGDKTMLVEINVTLNHYIGDTTQMQPIAFIYEHS